MVMVVADCVTSIKPNTHSPATPQEEMGLLQQCEPLKPLAASLDLWRRNHAEKAAHDQETQLLRREKSHREMEINRQRYLESEAKKREQQAKNKSSLNQAAATNANATTTVSVLNGANSLSGGSGGINANSQQQQSIRVPPQQNHAQVPEQGGVGPTNRKRKSTEPAPPPGGVLPRWPPENHSINGSIPFLDSMGGSAISGEDPVKRAQNMALMGQHGAGGQMIGFGVNQGPSRMEVAGFGGWGHMIPPDPSSNMMIPGAQFGAQSNHNAMQNANTAQESGQTGFQDVSSDNNIRFLLQGFDSFAHDDTVAEVLADVENEPSSSSASQLLKSMAQAKQSPSSCNNGSVERAPSQDSQNSQDQFFTANNWIKNSPSQTQPPPPYHSAAQDQQRFPTNTIPPQSHQQKHSPPIIPRVSQGQQISIQNQRTQPPNQDSLSFSPASSCATPHNPSASSPSNNAIILQSSMGQSMMTQSSASSVIMQNSNSQQHVGAMQAQQQRLQHYAAQQGVALQPGAMIGQVARGGPMNAGQMMAAVTGRARGPDNVNVALMQQQSATLRMQQEAHAATLQNLQQRQLSLEQQQQMQQARQQQHFSALQLPPVQQHLPGAMMGAQQFHGAAGQRQSNVPGSTGSIPSAMHNNPGAYFGMPGQGAMQGQRGMGLVPPLGAGAPPQQFLDNRGLTPAQQQQVMMQRQQQSMMVGPGNNQFVVNAGSTPSTTYY